MRYVFSLLFALLVLSACKKDEQTMDPPPSPVTSGDHFSGQTISADFSGTVTDETGSPVSGAMVQIGTSMTTTNSIGYFIIDNAQVDSKRAYVQVEAMGYFSGGAIKSYPSSTERNTLSIRLQSRGFANTVNGSTGGTVSNADGLALDFPPSALVSADGSPYSGTVNVYMHWLNPSESFDMLFIPGDLAAMDESEAVVLKSYSMIAVELEDASGNALEVAAGSEVGIQFPLDADLVGSAPSEIPLWYFDEESGLWINESSATLNGDQYEGSVSHFTWWNCDVPFNSVTVEICIVDSQNDPVTGVYLDLSSDSAGTVNTYLETSNCNIGEVPIGQSYILDVVDNCGNIVFTENLGLIAADTYLSFTYDPQPINTSFAATLVDCDGLPIDEGELIATNFNAFYTPSFILPISSDGVISNSTNWCNTQLDFLYIIDGQFVSLGGFFLPEGTFTDLDTLIICDQDFEMFDLTVLDSTYIMTETNFTVLANTIDILSYAGGNVFIDFCIPDSGLGTFPLCQVDNSYLYTAATGEFLFESGTVTILEYPVTQGDYISFEVDGIGSSKNAMVLPFHMEARLLFD